MCTRGQGRDETVACLTAAQSGPSLPNRTSPPERPGDAPNALPWDARNGGRYLHISALLNTFVVFPASHTQLRLNTRSCKAGQAEREDLSLNVFDFVFFSVVPKPQ